MLRHWGILCVVSYGLNYSLFYEAFNKPATYCLRHLAQGLTFSDSLQLLRHAAPNGTDKCLQVI
jgi:hypothetical protein